MAEEEFTIQELCNQTGFPRRTIHFYIQQEILPPPSGSGLGAHYGREHLLRLKLIPVLRQQGLRLDDIRQKFKSTSTAELDQMSGLPVPAAIKAPAPAGDPISGSPYILYNLPDGILLMVPNHLSPESRQKAQQLLSTARLLFSRQS